MGAGAEGTTWIDNDREKPLRSLLPGRSDPEPSDLDRAVEDAPVVLPTRFHPLGRDIAEARTKRLLDLRPAIDGQLEHLGKIPFLEAVRGELE
jgi:hypothetical protein